METKVLRESLHQVCDKYCAMNRITSTEEWKKVKNKWGIIYNESGLKHKLNSRGFNFPMLHSTSCGIIQSMKYRTSGGIDKYFFEDYLKAREWLNRNREGVKVIDCDKCNPEFVIKT